MNRRFVSLAALLAMTACVAPPPPAAPPAAEAPPPPPAPPPAIDWKDAPLSQGEWFFDPSARSVIFSHIVALRCTAGGGIQIESIALPGVMATSLDIRTTGAARTLIAERVATRLIARLAATDPIFDEIAYTRGRWALGPGGAAPTIMPARAEVARLIETCRGG